MVLISITVTHMLMANLMIVLIDIFDLAEQIGIYFAVKGNDPTENIQRRFFFILFAIGAISVFKPLFNQPRLHIIFSLCIENLKLILHLSFLPRTADLLTITILFFFIEVLFHVLALYTAWTSNGNYPNQRHPPCCTICMLLCWYEMMFETQILLLFVDSTSPFRDTFYEILINLSIFFGLIVVDKHFSWRLYIDDVNNDRSLYNIWRLIVNILGVVEYFILAMTGIVYASKLLHNSTQLKTYDFIVCILMLICYGVNVIVITLIAVAALHWYIPKWHRRSFRTNS
ncbi:unnamed protein product [Adineta ricciae]|uniref:Uncharacterized protein n=1 Tax=Adineta ricciae TaxID=249248 RepID=A0A814IMW3_ADIRI|nr:unnamed protein product [Adineta ricciae]CAF1026355.1 unnamed protein product [Adineta ricciae]